MKATVLRLSALYIILEDRPVQIGLPVEMVTRRIRAVGDEHGMLVYAYKFRLALR
jgi:hypothetical protein